MRKRGGRLDRFARLLPFLLAGGALGAGGLYAEYRLAGTVLLVPAFNWTSRRIEGGVLASPRGEYSLSFKHTRLDWRLLGRGGGPTGPAATAGTAAGWRLYVWEKAAGAGGDPWGEELPGAGGLRRAADGVVRGAFRPGSKDVTLEFVPPSAGAAPDEATLADMAEIVRSLKPSEMTTGPGS